MMRKNLVKDKLQRGGVVFGCMVLSTDPAVAEVLGMSGFDFLMMDGEHGSLNERILEHMVRACECAGTVPMARLPVNDPQAMLPFLDTGILGAQVPHCNTVADAARLVEGVKYPPIGNRGVTPGRVTNYAAIPTGQHAREWNEEMLAIVQVEEMEAVSNLPGMLSVEGADVFQIGLGDLSASMGYPGNAEHPEVQKTVAGMVRQIRDAGRWAGVATRSDNPELMKRYVDMGVQIIKFGDLRLLRERAVAVLAEARATLLTQT